jgi:hypothetical protein
MKGWKLIPNLWDKLKKSKTHDNNCDNEVHNYGYIADDITLYIHVFVSRQASITPSLDSS